MIVYKDKYHKHFKNQSLLIIQYILIFSIYLKFKALILKSYKKKLTSLFKLICYYFINTQYVEKKRSKTPTFTSPIFYNAVTQHELSILQANVQ